MIYRLPESNDKDILYEYVREHFLSGETSVSASAGLLRGEYADWMEKVRANALKGGAEQGGSLLYLCLDGDRLIGLLSIRCGLTGEMAVRYGHIGYGVRPSERRKGYATEMLSHALSVCREKGMDAVILGCYKDNLPSAAVIEKNGGVLIAENDNYTKGVLSRYYRIEL